MRYITIILSSIVFSTGCIFSGSKSTNTVELNRKPTISYENFLVEVKGERKKLKDKPLDEAKKYLFTLINEKIPAYWKGTPWDFNGVTRKPGEGKIACGYFITNTMVDLGFEIDRVKLAQAASSVLIDATCINTKWCSGIEGLKNHLDKQPEYSVFIVGLDFHTGYLTKEKNECYFIHSNYIGGKGVTKEKVEESQALQDSKVFYIGSITANDVFIKEWIN